MKTNLVLFSLLGLLLISSTSSVIAAEASSAATAQENIIVNTSAQVTLELAPVTTILASNYQAGTVLATWSASTTAGSLAFRMNPTVMSTNLTYQGTATSTTNANNKIPVRLVSHSGASCTLGTTTTLSGWSVCPQGMGDATGTIRTMNNQAIAVGAYPLSIDAAVWAY